MNTVHALAWNELLIDLSQIWQKKKCGPANPNSPE